MFEITDSPQETVTKNPPAVSPAPSLTVWCAWPGHESVGTTVYAFPAEDRMPDYVLLSISNHPMSTSLAMLPEDARRVARRLLAAADEAEGLA